MIACGSEAVKGHTSPGEGRGLRGACPQHALIKIALAAIGLIKDALPFRKFVDRGVTVDYKGRLRDPGDREGVDRIYGRSSAQGEQRAHADLGLVLTAEVRKAVDAWRGIGAEGMGKRARERAAGWAGE